MAFLGVGFYAGLVASSPDMLDSLDRYADTSNLYDINIISTLGLTDDDINEIKKIDGIESVYGIQTKDSLTKVEDKESICKVIEYNENINKPEVIYGRLPENSDECLLDEKYSYFGSSEENIGKTINSTRTVELENEIKKRIGTKSNAFLSIYNFLGFFCYYLAFAFSKDKTKNKSYNRTSKEYLP